MARTGAAIILTILLHHATSALGCTTQDNCNEDETECLTVEPLDKRACKAASKGYYLDADGKVAGQCTAQDNCQLPAKDCLASVAGLETKLACIVAAEGWYLNAQKVVERECTQQANCLASKTSCASDGELKCQTPETGYYLNNDIIEGICTPQARTLLLNNPYPSF